MAAQEYRAPESIGRLQQRAPPRGRHRAGAFHYWRREIPGTLLPILFDELHACPRIDPRLARAVDVAASHGRPVGNHHPALAGIGGAHASAPSRILSSHCFLRHDTCTRPGSIPKN